MKFDARESQNRVRQRSITFNFKSFFSHQKDDTREGGRLYCFHQPIKGTRTFVQIYMSTLLKKQHSCWRSPLEEKIKLILHTTVKKVISFINNLSLATIKYITLFVTLYMQY